MKQDTSKKAETVKKATPRLFTKKPAEVVPEIIGADTAQPPAKAKKEKPVIPESQIVKHAGDMLPLEMLQSSIKRDLLIAGRLEKASAMVSIKVGLALNAGKDMLRHGEYEPWLESQFGGDFGSRKAQYYSKLAKIFVAENRANLALPAPKETGNWLAVRDEGSDLAIAVSEFVGDLSLAELLDKHKIKAVKKTGGYRPSETMLNRFLQDHKTLTGIPFDAWTEEQRNEFRKWADEHNEGDSTEARAMAAEGAWHVIRKSLLDHGVDRKTWMLLGRETLQQSYDILSDVAKILGKALKA